MLNRYSFQARQPAGRYTKERREIKYFLIGTHKSSFQFEKNPVKGFVFIRKAPGILKTICGAGNNPKLKVLCI
jgi:hypothetical protein